jgi:hypothetical protein
MSKKFKNIIRPAYMRNFTTNTIDRFIFIDIDSMSAQEKDQLV